MRTADADLADALAELAAERGPIRPISVIDQVVTAGFYALVTLAALSFLASWWLPRLDVDDYMALSWSCMFGAALCLLTRLALLVLEDSGVPQRDIAG